MVLLLVAAAGAADGWTVIGWNDLGMQWIDADYEIFSLMPPSNTIHAQLIDPQGHLVDDAAGIQITYRAVSDPDGSINTTSQGKTTFWAHIEDLFGVVLPPDSGLVGFDMPGPQNEAQLMTYESQNGWFTAEGIPMTPYDDAGRKNFYPLVRITARDASGAVLATTDIVLPVSDETDCKTCHASDSSPAARPVAGWVRDRDPDRDMRLNVLRLHDDREGSRTAYHDALAAAGYRDDGLYATTTTGGTSILCARCHLSEALPGSGLAGVEPLTQAVHRRMAFTVDPITGVVLDSDANRAACYHCHPGPVTRFLRGAMGAAVAADGTPAMQCQSCHGSMRDVASPDRTGWLEEPRCQSCHTGTATSNNGQIRYTSVFEDSGETRAAVSSTFATNPDTPLPGLSLFRFSTGHGGVYCEACHGSSHAEFPSLQRNDNIQSIQHQGHVGMLSECVACHATVPITRDGGPHGLHPIGQSWVNRHGGFAEEGGAAACRTCHGVDYRGTILSRALADRSLNAGNFGRKEFWRGFQVGCYACHNGPDSERANPNLAPTVADDVLATVTNLAATLILVADDADGQPLTLRIVSQPSHGTVALDDRTATYFPETAFTGEDSFTFAAWDGSINSNLGRVTVTVARAPQSCIGDCNGDGIVTVDELIRGVGIALGNRAPSECTALDSNGDGRVEIEELIRAVGALLRGC